MKFNEQNEYYLVKGWFEQTNGMHNGSFYGAVATPDDYLSPKRAVVSGDDAVIASEAATKQSAKVYPRELLESDAGGLNPRERDETQRMLLDREAEEYIHIPTGKKAVKRADGWMVYCPHHADWILSKDQNDASYSLSVNEMTGAGAIGMAMICPTNTGKLGMSDRGGHGDIENKSKGKRVKTGRNTKVKGDNRNKLRGFGGKASIPSISQSGGRRGGNQ